mmetsp:Transcript_92198/g.266070  ORF Transcript_92198/g.266070 Transcript_92198/m.266070 type:complete len:319 (-) Transcript_92198:203-1159(-)
MQRARSHAGGGDGFRDVRGRGLTLDYGGRDRGHGDGAGGHGVDAGQRGDIPSDRGLQNGCFAAVLQRSRDARSADPSIRWHRDCRRDLHRTRRELDRHQIFRYFHRGRDDADHRVGKTREERRVCEQVVEGHRLDGHAKRHYLAQRLVLGLGRARARHRIERHRVRCRRRRRQRGARRRHRRPRPGESDLVRGDGACPPRVLAVLASACAIKVRRPCARRAGRVARQAAANGDLQEFPSRAPRRRGHELLSNAHLSGVGQDRSIERCAQVDPVRHVPHFELRVQGLRGARFVLPRVFVRLPVGVYVLARQLTDSLAAH